jgi:hypothetical protein
MKRGTGNHAAFGWAAAGLGVLLAGARAENSPAELDFYRDIHPFLESNCIPCHNKTTTKANKRARNMAFAIQSIMQNDAKKHGGSGGGGGWL